MNHAHAEISHESSDRFWRVIDEVQNAILFVLLGFEVLVIPFTTHSFEAGGLAIVSVVVVRCLIVAIVLSLVRLLQRGHKSSLLTLSWGGLRGGLSIALALSVPQLQSHTWVLATTYLVVAFSVVLQGGTLDLFLKNWQIRLRNEISYTGQIRRCSRKRSGERTLFFYFFYLD